MLIMQFQLFSVISVFFFTKTPFFLLFIVKEVILLNVLKIQISNLWVITNLESIFEMSLLLIVWFGDFGYIINFSIGL